MLYKLPDANIPFSPFSSPFDTPDGILYLRAREAFGQQGPDYEKLYCNRWGDVRNYRENQKDAFTFWEALTPAGELWLMLNVPPEAARIDV